VVGRELRDGGRRAARASSVASLRPATGDLWCRPNDIRIAPNRREGTTMAFTLPELPYAKDALAPHISAETLDYHHGKHHKAYVDKLNAAVAADPSLAGKSLEEIVRSAKGGVFNN